MKDRVRVLESQVSDLYRALQYAYDLHNTRGRVSTNYHRTVTDRINEMSPSTIHNDPQSSAERSNILNDVSAPTAVLQFSISE